jgi:predicted transposase
MKTIITAKLKLHTTPEQFAALRVTQLAYRDALNYVSQYAFAHGKMSNKVKLQDGTYDEVRARFHLPSQMACSVPRQVGATYKSLWKKVIQNTAARKAGQTREALQRTGQGSQVCFSHVNLSGAQGLHPEKRPAGEYSDAGWAHHCSLYRIEQACGDPSEQQGHWGGAALV